MGVSDDVIEASWNALLDAIRLELMRLTETDRTLDRAVEDYCWGVLVFRSSGGMSRRARFLPAAASFALFLVILATLVIQGLGLCAGHFGYPMDDTYIHMAMAKNFALHGVWGVTKYGFTSSTSSPFYTLLLSACYALTGVREVTPLILNILAAGAVLWWCNFVLLEADYSTGVSTRWRFLLLASIVAAVPLPILALGGMEHVLQTLLTLMFVHVCCRALAGSNGSAPLMFMLAALLVVTRYEGAFAVAIAGGLFLLRGKWRNTAGLALSSAVPLLAYGWISVRHGWSWVPNSLLLKANFPSANSAGMYPGFLGGLLRSWSRGAHVAVLIVIALVLLRLIVQKHGAVWTYTGTGLILFAATAVLHLMFARTGWFFRYEAYLVALGMMVNALAFLELSPLRVPRLLQALGVVFALLALARTSLAFSEAAHAVADIHDQQYQMGLFAKQHFAGETILLNDIGAVSFLSEARILDAIGLGSMASAAARRTGLYSSAWLTRWAADQGAAAAIMYPKLAAPEWRRVGRWTIPGNRMSGSDTVDFFGFPPIVKPTALAEDLASFRSQLPSRVVVTQ